MNKYRLVFGLGIIVLACKGMGDLFQPIDFFHISLMFGYLAAVLLGLSIIFEGG